MAGKDKGSALEQEMAGLKTQMASLTADNKRLQSLTMQFFTTPPVTQVPAADNIQDDKLPVDINFDGLPDPVAEPDKFRKQLAKRVKDGIRSGVEAGVARLPVGPRVDPQQAQRDAFYHDVWEGFKEQHPELAKFEGELSAVVAGEVSKLAAQNINVDRYIMSDPQTFMDSVATAATAKLEGLGVDLTVKEDKRNERVEDGHPARTLGDRIGGAGSVDDLEEPDNSGSLEIFGARPIADRTGGDRNDRGTRVSNLTDELKAVQTQMGLIGNRVQH